MPGFCPDPQWRRATGKAQALRIYIYIIIYIYIYIYLETMEISKRCRTSFGRFDGIFSHMWGDVSMGQFHGSRKIGTWHLQHDDGSGQLTWTLKFEPRHHTYIIYIIYIYIYVCICIYTRIWSSVLSNLTLVRLHLSPPTWPLAPCIRWVPRRCWRKGPASRGCPRSSSPWPCSARPENMDPLDPTNFPPGKLGLNPGHFTHISLI